MSGKEEIRAMKYCSSITAIHTTVSVPEEGSGTGKKKNYFFL